MASKYRNEILRHIKKYYNRLNRKDFSHDINHIFRLEHLAIRICKEEKADLEVVEAMCLLVDVARILEDEGEVDDHAKAGSEIARCILEKVNFPKEKIGNVCHAIYVHRKSKGRQPETIEAKILQDADYLDALGAVDIARVICSSIQSKKYRRPIYVDEPYIGNENRSAIHYLLHKVKHPKLQPSKFHTRLGRKLARERFEFMKNFTGRFIAEWKGEK